MKAITMPHRMLVRLCAAAAFVTAGTQLASSVFAQDSEFLACGQLSDRGQRIACLEDALEAAQHLPVPAQPASAPPGDAVSVAPPAVPRAPSLPAAPPAAPPTAPVAQGSVTAPAAAPAGEPSLLERLGSFGRGATATVTTDKEGQDQLHDTINKLEKRNNLWMVTLSSGQVWMQQLPRALNLREGDGISIYRAGFGNGYRMATPRLSGFIRVERIK